jgi:hypothetical protein
VINLIHEDHDGQPKKDKNKNKNKEKTQKKNKNRNKKTNRNDDKDSTKLKEWRMILNTFSKFRMFTWSFHLIVIVIVKSVCHSRSNWFLRTTIGTEKADLLLNPTKQFGMRSTIIHQK